VFSRKAVQSYGFSRNLQNFSALFLIFSFKKNAGKINFIVYQALKKSRKNLIFLLCHQS